MDSTKVSICWAPMTSTACTTLAAQAAVVLHRVKMTEAIIASEKLDQEITVARDVQMGAGGPPALTRGVPNALALLKKRMRRRNSPEASSKNGDANLAGHAGTVA